MHEQRLYYFDDLSPTAGKATGYAELIEHLHGKYSLDEAIEQIKIATRQLARRQMKWFRRSQMSTGSTAIGRWSKFCPKPWPSPPPQKRAKSPSMSIAIIDYGMANLRSVQKRWRTSANPPTSFPRRQRSHNADKIVLPGVGAFQDAVATLREKQLAEPIIRAHRSGKPFLGICLGLQMLFDVGYEDGEHRGLGVIRGKCVRFDVDRNHASQGPPHGLEQLDNPPAFAPVPRSSPRLRRLFRARLSRRSR